MNLQINFNFKVFKYQFWLETKSKYLMLAVSLIFMDKHLKLINYKYNFLCFITLCFWNRFLCFVFNHKHRYLMFEVSIWISVFNGLTGVQN